MDRCNRYVIAATAKCGGARVFWSKINNKFTENLGGATFYSKKSTALSPYRGWSFVSAKRSVKDCHVLTVECHLTDCTEGD